MKTILILIFVYILSAYMQYRWISISHSKGGIFEQSTPSRTDLVFTFTPILNTVTGIISWSIYYPKKSANNFNKFFNVKK